MHSNETPLICTGEYYTGSCGTLQVLAFVDEDDFQDTRQVIDDLLSGVVMNK
jgi:hypothetical protein